MPCLEAGRGLTRGKPVRQDQGWPFGRRPGGICLRGGGGGYWRRTRGGRAMARGGCFRGEPRRHLETAGAGGLTPRSYRKSEPHPVLGQACPLRAGRFIARHIYFGRSVGKLIVHLASLNRQGFQRVIGDSAGVHPVSIQHRFEGVRFFQ